MAKGHIYRIHLKVKAWNSLKLFFPQVFNWQKHRLGAIFQHWVINRSHQHS